MLACYIFLDHARSDTTIVYNFRSPDAREHEEEQLHQRRPMTGEIILGIVSLVVAIAAMVRRNFVRAVIFGLIYPCLLFVWPPSSLLVELVIVVALMGIDWLFASVEDDD